MENYHSTFSVKRLWIILAASVTVMFGVLLYYGGQIYQTVPPIPKEVVTSTNEVVFTEADILTGQTIWQSIGGMHQGSIWGHGSYLAPDWSADWLHREAVELDKYYTQVGVGGGSLTQEQQAVIIAEKIKQELKLNTYNSNTQTITISAERAKAIALVTQHYLNLFQGIGESALALREQYAFPKQTVLSEAESKNLAAFFFWTAWSSTTLRPDDTVSYTNNFPHEPLVGNTPSASVLMWSIFSIFLLIAGIGFLVWYYAKQFDMWRGDIEPEAGFAKSDIMESVLLTPSMRATLKYFVVVALLMIVQVILGIITAHYQVEGHGLYGIPLSDYLPYSLSRSWHTQLAVLWIATAWLASGLFFAPLLSGYEPKYQVLGVNFLFISLLIIVVGAFAGQWLSVFRLLGGDSQKIFYFGTQGYEYVDMGRFWQIYLFIGLLLWVFLVLRALAPALKQKENNSLLILVILSTVSIGLLYGAGLMYNEHTNIGIVEYWRWWVVHLWVEGVFEVFATAIVAVVFVKMGILRIRVATTSVMISAIIFLSGGVLGTFHHLYWSGTPISVLALGAVFSALEVVPLTVMGFEAYQHVYMEKKVSWHDNYKWPFRFFAGVLFWNMIGAGAFGFLINPPISLYYMQGLNTTANHGHAALFGVYGMLGIGLMLFCLRGLTDISKWSEKLISFSFWSLQIGMILMTFFSLLPQGFYQAYHSFQNSYYYARSAEFMHNPIMQFFVWARVPGDIIFALGIVSLVIFVLTLIKHRR
ncbi:MAG: nitric-oxide reductase large subunit [Methylacidiphilales bacterium]|nr:nitric-oxide reductase large subunit [Candidatus Methylacidiphilales bacterium]